ncbi:AlpA family phage regulatory protein [Novosphingobium sp.]|uniref:helix-turn-helix transcriptional regulator n=1 Tax=Novosphingobium sp. TaxID=1874826 RepID=UPI001EBC44F8|nr:AlpA family phage regulatory protein [Novosphingobium sp.]MBK6801684.1 AlpA family phage regulatory protein [Novosphingobium sp.]MBK9009948.1 AlpA family phage regulatory protein [Novosphingobium sp.]
MTKQQEQAPASAPTSLGRLLRMKDVERETSLHRATIYRGIKAGTFPAPRMIGAHRVAWPEADIEAWKANLLVRST